MKSLGVNGMAASSIGFVFLACISLGYFGGSWLDKRLGTTHWTPVLTVAGMLAGFIETFRTLRQITRNTTWPGVKTAEDSPQGEPSTPQSTVEFDRTASRATQVAPPASQSEESAQAQERPRLFHVPPPPLPEYRGRQTAQAELTEEQIAARLRGDDNDNDETDAASRTASS